MASNQFNIVEGTSIRDPQEKITDFHFWIF